MRATHFFQLLLKVRSTRLELSDALASPGRAGTIYTRTVHSRRAGTIYLLQAGGAGALLTDAAVGPVQFKQCQSQASQNI